MLKLGELSLCVLWLQSYRSICESVNKYTACSDMGSWSLWKGKDKSNPICFSLWTPKSALCWSKYLDISVAVSCFSCRGQYLHKKYINHQSLSVPIHFNITLWWNPSENKMSCKQRHWHNINKDKCRTFYWMCCIYITRSVVLSKGAVYFGSIGSVSCSKIHMNSPAPPTIPTTVSTGNANPNP